MLDPAARETLSARLRAAMDEVKDPCSVASGVPLGLDEMGIVDAVEVTAAGAATVRLRLTAPFCHMIGHFKTEAISRGMALEGITSVDLVADNGLDWSPSRMSEAARARREAHLARMRDARPPAMAAA